MSRRLVATFLITAVAATALSACGDTRRTLGLEQPPPDEFSVSPQVALAVPPDFALRPPEPGAARPQDVPVETTAQKNLLGDTPASGSTTPGTQALLAKTGGDTADPAIRTQVDRESTLLSQEDESFTDQLLFWQPRPEPGVVVDPVKEAQRMADDKKKGLSVAAGGPTPTIERKPQRAILEGLRDELHSLF